MGYQANSVGVIAVAWTSNEHLIVLRTGFRRILTAK